MLDFIICPNCGEKINLKQCSTKSKLFFSYKICRCCGCNFTTISDKSIKTHIFAYFSILFILAVGDILIGVFSDQITNLLFLIMTSTVILGMGLNFLYQVKFKKNLENPHNCFFIITVNNSRGRMLNYIFENEVPANEYNLKYTEINKNHINILLPCSDIRMLAVTKENLEKLKLYGAYKIIIDKMEYFFILSDLTIDNGNVSLYFKSFKEMPMNNNNLYELNTINDQAICLVKKEVKT